MNDHFSLRLGAFLGPGVSVLSEGSVGKIGTRVMMGASGYK
jgi:hypothetical protein